MNEALPRVLHVIPTFSAGGAERLVFELVRLLPSYGFDASAIAIMGSGPLKSLFDDAGVPYKIFSRRESTDVKIFFQLKALLRTERPTIVHTHLFGADTIGRLAALASRTPVIVSTAHNVFPDVGFVKHAVNGLLARASSSVIAISSVVRDDLISREHVPPRKIAVIPNGIDLSSVIPRQARPFHDVPRLIAVGRLMEQKGHADLLNALALVKRPWTLEIIGTGPLERELHALADKLHISPRIHWLGYRNDVPERLAESDLFCFPSRWEGLGLAFIEAAAAGIPIIASDLPVFRDVLSAAETTYVETRNVEAFASSIDALLQDPASAIQRAVSASGRIRSACSIEQMVSAYADLYRSLLASRT